MVNIELGHAIMITADAFQTLVDVAKEANLQKF